MQRLLSSVWNEPRPANPPPRAWRDWALVGVIVLAAVLEGVLRRELPWLLPSVMVTVALTPTLLWRRAKPLLMLAIAFGISSLAPLFMDGTAPELYSMAYLLILPYSLLRWGSGREAVIGLTVVVAKILLWLALGYLTQTDTIGGLTIWFAACVLGVALRYRANARTRELDQAKLLEREHLARDLHDVVAHHVSAIAIRAQAGIATSAAKPSAAVDALQVIEAEASRALTEMRSMVRVLRQNEPVELAPVLGIGDLERLANHAAAGPSVDVEISGDVSGVPATVGNAIYHLAQESVTNARRHARHASRILVCVAAECTSVRLRVTDDGDVVTSSAGGYGLVGMRERANLLGGTCEAGPSPGRGWTVTAVLPLAGASA